MITYRQPANGRDRQPKPETMERLEVVFAHLRKTGHLTQSAQRAGLVAGSVHLMIRRNKALNIRYHEIMAAFRRDDMAEAVAKDGGIPRVGQTPDPAEPAPDLPIDWRPLAGPQARAFESAADFLLYGGAAGGGKTDLLLGLALKSHARAVIFRREYPQLKALEDRAAEIIGMAGRYNATRHVWRFAGNRVLEFGAVQNPGDERKWQGRPHDLKAFDEITHFTEQQFRFLCGWNRSAVPGQRVRVVCAGNPPTTAEGDWVIKFWAPWLDRQHPNPAAPGELRWYARIAGKEIEVAGPDPIHIHTEVIQPTSRTFIPARVEDNPFLMESGYPMMLQTLPEPLRSQMLNGDFSVAQEDNPLQVLPTAWVLAAQARWVPEPPGAMDAIGVDVARGGQDQTVLTPRHGPWFGHPRVHPGSTTPDGPAVVALIAGMVRGRAKVQIDVIGVGSSVFDMAKSQGLNAEAMNGSAASKARDKSRQLGFANLRAEWYWKLREALDPDTGEALMLPPDRELLADLTAPRWRIGSRGVQIESKDEIRARIGRSPDKGDSLVYAHAQTWFPGQGAFLYMKQMAEEVQAKKAAEALGENDPNRMKGKWWRRLPNGGWQVNTTGEPEW